MSLNPSPSVYPRVNGSLVVVAGGCPLLAGGERGGARVDQLEEFHLTLRAGSPTAHWQQVDISLTISPLAWSFAACRLEDCHEDQQTGDLVGGGNQELGEDLASQNIYLSDGSHVTEPPTTQPEIHFVIDETGDLLYDFSINSTENNKESSEEDKEETSSAPVTFLDYEQTTTEESGLTFEHSSESSSEELRYTVEPSLDGDESVQFGEYGVEQTTREESVFTLERSSEEVWYTVEPSPEKEERVREHGIRRSLDIIKMRFQLQVSQLELQKVRTHKMSTLFRQSFKTKSMMTGPLFLVQHSHSVTILSLQRMAAIT